MKLFIVESPNKCGKLRKFLGNDYNVTASVGHVRNLPRKGINIDVRHGFEPTYEVSEKKKDVVKKILELSSKAEEIILATDPDREGEAISFHIYDLLPAKDKKKCTRVTFTEITKKAVLEALKNKRAIDDNLVQAQKARVVLDRLIGYKISPLLWVSVASKTSAGRVQSIALKLICDRHKEIEAFVPKDFWVIEADLLAQTGDFWAKVVTKEKDNRYYDGQVAKDDFEKLKKATYTVKDVVRATKKTKAHPPFDTTSLQTVCSSLFGWNATKTMKLAQALYESGHITYLRTDSYSISKEAVEEVRELISKAASKEYLPKTPNKYVKKSTAAAQEAHECIRPTHCYNKGEDIDGSDHLKMYKLIRDRFIACQMTPMIVDTVTYKIKADTGHDLIATGQAIKFEGWRKVYQYSKSKNEMLPNVEKDEELELKDIKNTKSTTQPPPRYNDGSLVKKMEKEGVGRPSTRASIIKTLIDRNYVEEKRERENQKKKKGFVATELGLRISDYLTPNFKDFFMDEKFTASLESDLDEIAEGKKSFLDVVESVYGMIKAHVKAIDPPKKVNVDTGEKCTKCKSGSIVQKTGRYGAFYSCSCYPECKTIYTQNDDGSFVVKEKTKAKKLGKCLKCEKGSIVERNGKFGKFYACDQFPRCKTIFSKNDDNSFGIYKKGDS